MAKKSSTGALTQEQHAAQDTLYAQGHTYDYLFIGAGHSALVAASLLANAGKKVCVLEYHDKPGGYAHTFEMQGFKFCAQIHYIWGCAPGGAIHGVLKKLGLEKEITFEPFDLDGFDVIRMPDGKFVKLPNGFDKACDNIDAAYPGNRAGLEKFFTIMKALRAEFKNVPKKITLGSVLTKGWSFRHVIKYRNATLQDIFNECKLLPEHQAVLGGFLGDLASPPDEISIFPYVGLYGGYNTGAYGATHQFEHYIDGLAGAITRHDGCHIYYETEVTKISESGGKIASVETQNGRTFTADTIVCNMDPQAAAKLIGMDKFPGKQQKLLNYEYTPSAMTIYLGLKDIDLTKHHFGNFNIWHLEDVDLNSMWREQGKGNYDKIWMFLSTPLLHGGPTAGHAPDGHSILEIATLANFDFFEDAQGENYGKYAKLKLQYANWILDKIEEHYIPDLKKHIVVKTIGTPTTNRDYAYAPAGNVYGSLMTPQNLTSRLSKDTPFENFYWCNASSGYAGMAGTAYTGLRFYEDMTGDTVLTEADQALTDDDVIAALYQKYGKAH